MDALPKITNNIRVIPNGFARSSLFSVSDTRVPRQFFNNVDVPSPSGMSLSYKGEELRQDDADVFLSLVFLLSSSRATREEFTTEIIFHAKELFGLMGWPYRNFYIEKLKNCLDRMKEGTFRYPEKLGITAISIFSYIHYPLDKNDKSLYIVRVSNDLFKIFDTNFTKININVRKKLKPMAKWLYSYYSSHTEPFPHKCETLKNYCGSGYKDLRNFRVALKRALQELQDVGFFHSFFIDKANDLVHVRRQDILKNSNDEFFSEDLLNILHIIVEKTEKPRIELSEIHDVYKKTGGEIKDTKEFSTMIYRCLDELVKYKKLLSYIINNDDSVSLFRKRMD